MDGGVEEVINRPIECDEWIRMRWWRVNNSEWWRGEGGWDEVGVKWRAEWCLLLCFPRSSMCTMCLSLLLEKWTNETWPFCFGARNLCGSGAGQAGKAEFTSTSFRKKSLVDRVLVEGYHWSHRAGTKVRRSLTLTLTNQIKEVKWCQLISLTFSISKYSFLVRGLCHCRFYYTACCKSYIATSKSGETRKWHTFSFFCSPSNTYVWVWNQDLIWNHTRAGPPLSPSLWHREDRHWSLHTFTYEPHLATTSHLDIIFSTHQFMPYLKETLRESILAYFHLTALTIHKCKAEFDCCLYSELLEISKILYHQYRPSSCRNW
jgi:hypothetical protein